MDERLIIHVDVNSAFLSWEAMRRVKNGEPDLRLIPSCIGGDPESRRGVVLAKSIPAKAFKIKTGEPIAMAMKKCPQLVITKPDFKLYSACSKAFKDICRSYAPVVEEFSIDECFMDMTGTGHMYPDPVALAHTIKNKIRDELGFTVNIGIGRNKLCAKMASGSRTSSGHYQWGTCCSWAAPLRLGSGKNVFSRLESLRILIWSSCEGSSATR